MSESIADRLMKPFPPKSLFWRPGSRLPDREDKRPVCLAIPEVLYDSVRQRMLEVFGVSGYSEEYVILPNNQVQCSLTVRISGEAATRVGIGPIAAPITGQAPMTYDRSYAQAFKAACANFGVGSYLSRIVAIPALCTVDKDGKPVTVQSVLQPLPAWAQHPDWMPCGGVLGNAVAHAIDECAKAAKVESVALRKELFEKHDLPLNLSNHDIPSAVAREIKIEIAAMLQEIAKAKPPQERPRAGANQAAKAG